MIGINEKTKEIVFGEVKWSKNEVGTDIYENLKEKAGKVAWNTSNRKEYYILFSKSGFTKNMKDLAKKENVFLVRQDRLLS